MAGVCLNKASHVLRQWSLLVPIFLDLGAAFEAAGQDLFLLHSARHFYPPLASGGRCFPSFPANRRPVAAEGLSAASWPAPLGAHQSGFCMSKNDSSSSPKPGVSLSCSRG